MHTCCLCFRNLSKRVPSSAGGESTYQLWQLIMHHTIYNIAYNIIYTSNPNHTQPQSNPLDEWF